MRSAIAAMLQQIASAAMMIWIPGPFRSCTHGLEYHPLGACEWTASIVKGFLRHDTSGPDAALL